ncbi:MAG: energy transducer TonB [Pseudomonadota bacterium]
MSRHALAALVSVAVNLGVLGLFLRLNDTLQGHAASVDAQIAVVDFVAPPPPARRPRPPAPRPAEAPVKAAPRIPNLPSAMQAPELLDLDLDGVDLLAGLIGDGLGGAGLVMAEDQVDRPPEVLSRVPPRYPTAALDAEREGVVTLRLLVDQEGAVQRVEVLEAEPPGVFEQAATDAVSQWRYRPAVYQGRDVRCWYRQRVVFRLE